MRGVESEAVLPFAAIADLLLPLREHLELLPPTQREAVQGCLAFAAGPAHGKLPACAGALSVLAAAAEERPLVIVVDDFHWVDPESAQILLSVARRRTQPLWVPTTSSGSLACWFAGGGGRA